MAKMVQCARCKGKGTIKEGTFLIGGTEKKCPACGGSGKVEQK